MSTNQKQTGGFPIPNYAVFLIVLAVSILIYKFIFGASSNLDEHGHAKPGNILGMIYMGGFIVPVLLTLFISMWVFAIERFLSLRKATGGKHVESFLQNVSSALDNNNFDDARQMCMDQKGSIANVTLTGIDAYEDMTKASGLDKDQKVLTIQKEMEQSVALEVPELSKNMSILSTIATVATLAGLIGTVLGMIRSFAALATAGAPDQTALATGISEALINTALGISTSFFAIVFYNYFNSQIEDMTYKMDESQFLISQSFASKN
jgi:biopolymer transport protein ExbB